MDNLFDQMINITKAHAYDIVIPELKKEILFLKSEKAQLEIRLKGSQQMCEALKDAFNSIRPEGSQVFELSDIDKEIEQEFADHNDIKDCF